MNLAEARRLHDRCPHDPGNCTTCRTEEWPCPTALALGATGRSEWEDAPEETRNAYPVGDCDITTNCTGPLDHPGSCTPSWAPCGMYSTRNEGSLGPCVRDSTHDHGPHRAANGDTW